MNTRHIQMNTVQGKNKPGTRGNGQEKNRTQQYLQGNPSSIHESRMSGEQTIEKDKEEIP